MNNSKYYSEEIYNRVKDYLSEKGFYESLKNKDFDINIKLKNILLESLENYFENRINLNFLLLLAGEIEDEIGVLNDLETTIKTAICGLTDILWGLTPKEKIDEDLKDILKFLKNEVME
jgi:hypothetical protein